MDSLISKTFNLDIFKPKELLVNIGGGQVPRIPFLTVLGENFITSNGDIFLVKND